MLDQTVFINNSETLANALSAIKPHELAIDTEFIRTRTYRPILALIQLSTGSEHFIVDPLLVDDLSPLNDWMQDPQHVSIFHACGEDMEIFLNHFGQLPANLADTQIAASVAGIGTSMGYQRLMKHMLDIDIDKEASRSDWLARPLSDMQLDYAVKDVAHLPELHHKLSEQLHQLGRWDWYKQECALWQNPDRYRTDPEHAYLRFKGLWRLSPISLTVMQRLCRWREIVAQQKDIARGRITPDKVLYQLAEQLPADANALRYLSDLDQRTANRYKSTWLDIIADVKELPKDALLAPQRQPQKKAPAFIQLKTLLKTRCEALGIGEEMVCNGTLLEIIAANPTRWKNEIGTTLSPWREHIIEEIVNEIQHD